MKELQSAILKLTPAEIDKLRGWLAKLDAQKIEEKLEHDAVAKSPRRD